jgi:hypothetical protein
MPSRRTYKSSSRLSYFRQSIYTLAGTLFTPPTLKVITQAVSTTPTGTVVVVEQQVDTTNDPCVIYQNYVIEVIQFIIDKVSFDTIIESLRLHRQEIKTHAEAQKKLLDIQTMILSVINMISSSVNIKLVLERIEYIQNVLDENDDQNMAIYGDIFDMVIEIIDEIIDKQQFQQVLENLKKIQQYIIPETEAAKGIIAVQQQIIRVIENIIAGTSMIFVIEHIFKIKEEMDFIVSLKVC